MGQVNCCRSSRADPEPVQQCLPVGASPEPLQRQRVRVTQGRRTRKKDLLLFRDTLVVAKAKRGSTPCPKLCLALATLQVLSGGKGAAGNDPEEEGGKASKSLVLVWPSSSCVITFCSHMVKELWVSALLGPPEGVEGARVTQLPSIKPLLKELRHRKAATPIRASSLERLVKAQAEAGPKQRAPAMSSGSQASPCHTADQPRKRWYLPFARQGTLAAAEKPGPSGSGGRGALFGRPLAAICSQDGTLPQHLQDLLALLQEHGPSTEGIFRLAAGERASRELREALDSGAEVHLQSQPATLLAVILKDFLRKIPSKLLEAELYGEWMSALQQSSREEKLSGLKEVASKLPKANLLLFKRLLALLHTISSNVATSRMTAQNLAICVGPNLLSPPEEHALPLDVLVQETQKVTQLVEFLIEHARELLGEEVPGLARAPGDGSPALQLEAEAAEVPPVAAHTKHPKTSCQERRLPGSSQASRKRKSACEEGSNGQPEQKHRRLEREVSWTGSLGNPSRSPFNFSAWIPCINSGAWASSTTSVEARREAPMSSCSVQPISLPQPVIIFSAPATKENTRGSLQPLSLLRRRQRKEEKREQERRNSSKRK